jgi:hypothetical protein
LFQISGLPPSRKAPYGIAAVSVVVVVAFTVCVYDIEVLAACQLASPL